MLLQRRVEKLVRKRQMNISLISYLTCSDMVWTCYYSIKIKFLHDFT